MKSKRHFWYTIWCHGLAAIDNHQTIKTTYLVDRLWRDFQHLEDLARRKTEYINNFS